MRRLCLRGPGSGVVGLDFRKGGGPDRVSGRGHRVVDVVVDEIVDGVVVEGVADEGVGDTVLYGAQVDMRQQRLGHGADDAGDAGQLVGQRLVDHDVAGMGTLVRVHDPQKAVPFPRVQRNVAGFDEDVFVEHEVDSGCLVQRQVGLGMQQRRISHPQGQIVLKQRHAGREQSISARQNTEGLIGVISVA